MSVGRYSHGAVALVGIMAVLLTACGTGNSASPASAGADATGTTASSGPAGTSAESRSVTFGVVGIPPIFVNSIAYVAKENNFFAKRHLDVTIRPFTTGVDVGRAIQSGQIDGGIVGTPGLIALRASGSSAVGVLGLPKPDMILASTDPSVTSCESVKGKTVAVDAVGAPKTLALYSIIASCGLTKADVHAITVGGPQTVDALVSGQVKLAIFHPDELAFAASKLPSGTTVKAVKTLAESDPLEHYLLITTLKKELTGPSRAEWVDMVAALHEAELFMFDPANAKSVAATASEISKEPTTITAPALTTFLNLGVYSKDSGLDRASIEHTIQEAVTAGNIKQANAPTYDEMIDPSIYADAVK